MPNTTSSGRPRALWALLLSAAIAHVAFEGAVAARKAKQPPAVCRGEDMLAGLSVTDPAAHGRILESGRPIANQQALLWRVERAGLAPSHLFGTIHVTDGRVSTLSPAVVAALDQARAVAVEVTDVSPDAAGKAMAEASALVTFTDHQRLDRLITPEAFQKAQTALGRARVPTTSLRQLKPWVVTLILAVGPCERTALDRGAKVLDQVIVDRARARKIPVVGLETLGEQLQAAAAIPLADQVELLKTAIAFSDRTDDLSEALLQLYLARRIGAALPFQSHLMEQAGARPEAITAFRREMIEKRNRTMRTRALPLLAKGGVFIAVGALHLPDADGLVALLRDAGYTVTSVD
ncbi:MAG: TraB/GumN family protein [Hyphomicrobiaceae bacterium]|nr:TraB/GumN family protein [Hyphomicrobiaceae bacterium]